ncbi:MAG: ACT domain-containing protein [Candidatus Eisenbacteria bacterium]
MGLRLRRTDWRLAIVRFSPEATPPAWVFHASVEFYSLTRTPNELSIVCSEDDLPPSVDFNVQRGWAAFEVEGPLPFGLTGVVSGITAPLAAAGVPVFVISTYDTDYLLVEFANLETAERVLSQHFSID